MTYNVNDNYKAGDKISIKICDAIRFYTMCSDGIFYNSEDVEFCDYSQNYFSREKNKNISAYYINDKGERELCSNIDSLYDDESYIRINNIFNGCEFCHRSLVLKKDKKYFYKNDPNILQKYCIYFSAKKNILETETVEAKIIDEARVLAQAKRIESGLSYDVYSFNAEES